MQVADSRPRLYRHGLRRLAPLAGGGLSWVLLLVVAGGPNTSAAATARAARTIQVSESAHLHLTSHRGITLNEEGTATGTIKGKIFIHLQLRSQSRVFAEVNIYPSGGSLSGTGSASYRYAGSYATFSGTFAVTRGTGGFAHAHGSGMRFGGTIQRRTGAVSVTLSGRLSE